MTFCRYFLISGILFIGVLVAEEAPDQLGTEFEVRRLAIDNGRPEFATEMTVLLPDDRTAVAAWKAYQSGLEKILGRRIDLETGNLDLVFELTEKPGVLANLTGWARETDIGPSMSRFTWSEWDSKSEKWKVAAHRFQNGVFPSGTLFEKGFAGIRSSYYHSALASQELTGNQKSEINFAFGMGFWPEKEQLSTISDGTAFRPVVSGRGNTLWTFWDEYDESNGEQRIRGRQLYPEIGNIEAISPQDPGSRCIAPVVLDSGNEGLCVAWVKLTDAIAGDGVVDMIHTAHVATISSDDKWTMIVDEKGSDEGAVFLNGLLPDLRKGKGYPSGFSGNRRKPMLLDGKDCVWLLWERKSKHSGSGSKTAGQLLGRKFKDGRWAGIPLLLHEGLIDYRLAKPEKVIADGNTFYVVGSEIPHHWKRPSYLVEVNLVKAKTIELDDWRDQFQRINLPFDNEADRYVTEGGDGKKYQLFWGDLHCHSGLTGDAEGEPDEIVLYARDRARLDVMVLQDNDEVHGRILTEGEYQLGVTHSQWITEPGKFVALPGYEWTQRTSAKGVPEPFLSSFEQNIPGGYPNHRTVIYPMRGGPIIRYFEVGHDFDYFARRVAAAGGILHSQHPAFEISDHPIEANLEVTACWGIYIRNVPAKFHAELDKGRRMGFIGTSDSHRRNPGLCGGLTGIYAEELTPEAILEALKKHRVFATNGSKIVVDSRAGGYLSDHVLQVTNGEVVLSLSLQGTAPIKSARLMGTGGKTIAQFEGDGSNQFEMEKKLTNLAVGNHWFYWAIEQEGNSTQYSGNISVARGNLAWSSPHFVEVKGSQ